MVHERSDRNQDLCVKPHALRVVGERHRRGAIRGGARLSRAGAARVDGLAANLRLSHAGALALLDRLGITLRLDFKLQKWGLGYSLTELSWPALRLSARQFVFPTPLDGEWVELNFAVSVKHGAGARTRRHALLEDAARGLLLRQFEHELGKDIPFWESTRYLSRPAIDASDGPIGEYRRFCKQFYPVALGQVTPSTGMRTLP
jgi:hypothetical protein